MLSRIKSQQLYSGADEFLVNSAGSTEALMGYGNLLYPGLFYTLLKRGRFRHALSEARARRRVQGVPLLRSFKDMLKAILPDRTQGRNPPSWLRATPVPSMPGRGLAAHHLFALDTQPLPMFNHHLDRTTMSLALEARNPFLDYRVVECGLAFEPDDYVLDGYTKWTLREAMRHLLPEKVVDRGRKQGFTTDEVEGAKKAILSSRMVGRSTDAALLNLMVSHEQLNRPLKWDADLEARIQSLTADQVNAAFRKHIDPKSVSIVKAGDFKAAGVYK